MHRWQRVRRGVDDGDAVRSGNVLGRRRVVGVQALHVRPLLIRGEHQLHQVTRGLQAVLRGLLHGVGFVTITCLLHGLLHALCGCASRVGPRVSARLTIDVTIDVSRDATTDE